jgi:hypothetical protein
VDYGPILLLLLTALGGLVVPTGCSSEAVLYREHESGGIATYPYQSDSDLLTSAGRTNALQLIDEKCAGGSRIVKEGEIPKVSKAADRAWRGQMSGDRLWGIQFVCD